MSQRELVDGAGAGVEPEGEDALKTPTTSRSSKEVEPAAAGPSYSFLPDASTAEMKDAEQLEDGVWCWKPFLLDVLQLDVLDANEWHWCVVDVKSELSSEEGGFKHIRGIGLCDIEAIRMSKKDPREFRVELMPSASEVDGKTCCDYKKSEKGSSMIKFRTLDGKPCNRWVHAVSEVVTRMRLLQG